MTFNDWLRLLKRDVPDCEREIKRLLAAGFTFNNGVDVQRHAELAFDAPAGGRAYPTTFRITLRRHRTFELVLDARLDLVSATIEADQGELEPIAYGNSWQNAVDAILEADA